MLGLKGVERLECSFDDLEKRVPWFVEGIRNRIIIVEDAVVGLEQGKLLWARGIWKGGIWKNGIWSNGTWERGTWKSGWWNNGTWLGGWWYKGTWNNGTWVTGKDFKGITHVYAPNTWNTPAEKSTNGKILVITDQGSLDRKAKVEDMINNTYVVKVPDTVEKWEISRKMTTLERTRKDVSCLVSINESDIISWEEFVELTKTKEETLKEKIIAELKNSSLSIDDLIEKIKSL